jgi:hypothetical protein
MHTSHSALQALDLRSLTLKIPCEGVSSGGGLGGLAPRLVSLVDHHQEVFPQLSHLLLQR